MKVKRQRTRGNRVRDIIRLLSVFFVVTAIGVTVLLAVDYFQYRQQSGEMADRAPAAPRSRSSKPATPRIQSSPGRNLLADLPSYEQTLRTPPVVDETPSLDEYQAKVDAADNEVAKPDSATSRSENADLLRRYRAQEAAVRRDQQEAFEAREEIATAATPALPPASPMLQEEADTVAAEPAFGDELAAMAPSVAATSPDSDDTLASAPPEPRIRQAPPALPTTRAFLEHQESVAGLTFQQPQGYWSNRYLPGDPLMRILGARLARLGDAERLDAITTAARQNWQPFDPPRDAALALYLAADKAAVETTSRLRLQVGLQGTPRLGGQRPPMHLGIVLDLRGMDDTATASAARALLLELARARQAGDHFSLVLSGQQDLALAPEAFRFGALQLVLDQLPPTPGRDVRVALFAALRTATVQIRASDDPDAPLGSSMVLLLATAPLPEGDPALETLAHYNTLAGIGLSVIAVGRHAPAASGEALALAGQGQRWLLGEAREAARLAEEILYASTRVVARAVRLRIVLAPAVKLVEVLGAEKLDEPQAQRVREAEQSIDLRTARNLGIRADRGEDEAGIQIVIPHYYADSAHVVLLDLLVPGPGPVAEVNVRYKDLVHGRNGVAHAQFALPGGEQEPGPLQRNVLKNHLAHEIAGMLRRAGEYLASDKPEAARRALSKGQALLRGMQHIVPAWQQDRELLADLALLEAAMAALGQGQPYLGPALRLAAYHRLVADR